MAQVKLCGRNRVHVPLRKTTHEFVGLGLVWYNEFQTCFFFISLFSFGGISMSNITLGRDMIWVEDKWLSEGHSHVETQLLIITFSTYHNIIWPSLHFSVRSHTHSFILQIMLLHKVMSRIYIYIILRKS